MAQSSASDEATPSQNREQPALCLPVEIVRTICDLLDNRTIKNLRLTCGFYSQSATLRLGRVIISANLRNIEVFKAVANHESLRLQVTEIIWDDATLYEGPRMPREDEEAYYPGDDDFDDEEDEDCYDHVQDGDGIDWGGNIPSWYIKACKENISDFKQAKGDDIERPDHAARAEQLSSHIPAKEAWAYYKELLKQQREILDSEEHVRAFTEYISQSFSS